MSKIQTAIVTGAGSGIGRATTLRFIQGGASVLAVDLNDDMLEETCQLAGRPDAIVKFVGDVTDPDVPKSAIEAAVSNFGHLDTLVNNAGGGGSKPALDTTDDDWDRMLSLNLTALFRFSREALRVLEPGSGSIVNVASIAGIIALVGSPAYVASKSGVIGLTHQLATDYAQSGFRVNAVAPGLIETPLTQDRIASDPRFEAINIDPIPMPRLGQVEDIANGIYFLASDQASYVNGHVLTIDGGWSVSSYSRRGVAM